MTALRTQQVSLVKQALVGKTDGMPRNDLAVALDGRLSDKQLLAVLNTMASNDLLFKVHRFGIPHYVLATENMPKPFLPKKAITPRSALRADNDRLRAAGMGVTAVIPPSSSSIDGAETVEHWMTRTGKQPDVLPHNFDEPHTAFPGRRPIITKSNRNG